MIYLALIASLIATTHGVTGCISDPTVCIENEICNADTCEYAYCTTLDDCTTNYPAMNFVQCDMPTYGGVCIQDCTTTATFCADVFFGQADTCDTSTGLCGDSVPANCLDNPSEVPCYTEQICNSTSKTCEWISCDNGACTEPTRPICDVTDHCAQNCSTQISTFCTDRYYGSFANKAACFPDSGKCLKATCLNSISEACAANEICNSTDIDLVFCETIPCAKDSGACSNPELPICDKDDYCAPNCTISSTFCNDIYTETTCFPTSGKCLTPTCVNSPITEACQYDKYCDTKTEQCKYNFCEVNSDCTENLLPVCNGNNCEPYCDILASDYCHTATEYGTGFVCDATLKQCVRYCFSNDFCGDTDYVCDTSILYDVNKGICKDLTKCTDDTECKKLFGIFKNFADPVPWPLATCDETNRRCSEECAIGGCEGISDYYTDITGTEDRWEYACNTNTVPETCDKRACQNATVCKNDLECNGGYCWDQTDAPTHNPSMPSYAPSTPSVSPLSDDGEDQEPVDGGKAVERYNVFGIYVVVFVMVLSMKFM